MAVGLGTRIPKRAKIVIGVIGASAALVLLLLLIGFAGIALLYGVAPYAERDPDELISALERMFEIDFPGEITEVRAAVTPVTWDSGVSFVLKFKAVPETVNDLFELHGRRRYAPGAKDEDRRQTRSGAPEWSMEPITEGIMGHISLPCRKGPGPRTGPQSGTVYIDTSDSQSYLVYLLSGYDAEWERATRRRESSGQ